VSVSYRLDGLLHLTDHGVALEWIETRTLEQVSLEKIGTDVDEVATDILEVPMARLAGAWVIGGWWWPQLELRARGFKDFEEVPGARGVSLRLRIHRRDRALARAIAGEIQAGVAAESALSHHSNSC
jgi:hypothetical protein